MFFIFIYLSVFIGLMYFVKNNKIRNHILLAASLLFYCFGDIKHITVLITVFLITYFFALKVKSNPKIYVIYLVLVLGILSYFKYGTYLMSTLTIYIKTLDFFKIIMPLGISFYTFTSISYVSDVYYEKYEAEKNALNLASFLSFFPVVISGPLIRYDTFKNFLGEKNINVDNIASGLRRFIVGLAKKVIIANQLSIVCNTLFSDNVETSFLIAGYQLAAYALQLYYDFSGYSDMAIGIGKMIGYSVSENFDTPYFSHSIAEFWRRWHISLGTWFKEYLYYPLLRNGFVNKLIKKWSLKVSKKQARTLATVLVLFITWFLIGCWHGTSYRFVLYGLYHGFFIILSTILEKTYIKCKQVLHINDSSAFYKAFQIIRTDVIVTIGYILFRCDTLKQIKNVVNALIGRGFQFNAFYTRQLDILYLLFYFVLGLVFLFPFVHRFFKKINDKIPVLYDFLLVALMALSVFYTVSGSYSAFIYFNF